MFHGQASGAYPGPYVGSRILGHSGVCAVYSEDLRRNSDENGVYHLYVDNYGTDLVRSFLPVFIIDGVRETSGGINGKGRPVEQLEITPDLFHTETRFSSLVNPSLRISYTVFSATDGSTVFDIAMSNASSRSMSITLQPTMQYRRSNATSPGQKQLKQIDLDGFTFATLSMGDLRLGLGMIGDSRSAEVRHENDSVTLAQKILIPAGETARTKMILKCWRRGEPLSFSRKSADFDVAMKFARNWLDGKNPDRPDITDPILKRAYESSLLALAATELRGAVPADMTGQFVTNNMPQLYPRDALMTARALLACGQPEPAKRIIDYWNASIPEKTPGEWYARYDAFAAATPGGSGAAYDLPEWDSNGYYASLLLEYFMRTGEMIGDYDLMKRLLNFVCAHQDAGGLVKEGGIVEWEGLLPSTNMNLAAGLRAGTLLARMRNDAEAARKYREAAEKMEAGMNRLFSKRRGAYMDLRGPDGAPQDSGIISADVGARVTADEKFNTSSNFGFLWGYPDHFELAATNAWYRGAAHKLGGGVQYFEANGYGSDMFGFTTGASAQYHALAGEHSITREHLRWMMERSNIYGMMPERIFFPDGKEVSPASPLSWCNAEFAMAVREAVLTGTPGVATGSYTALSFIADEIEAMRAIIKAIPHSGVATELLSQLGGGIMAARQEANAADQARLLHDLISDLEQAADADVRYLTSRIRMRFSRIIANLSGLSFQISSADRVAMKENLTLQLTGVAAQEVSVASALLEWRDGNGALQSTELVLKRTPAGFAKTTTINFQKGDAPYQTAIRATLRGKWKNIPFTLNRTIGISVLPRFEIRQTESETGITIRIVSHIDSAALLPGIIPPRGWSVRPAGAWNFTAIPEAGVPPGFHKFTLVTEKRGSAKREEHDFDAGYKTVLDISGKWWFRSGDDTSWADAEFSSREWQLIQVPAQWEQNGFADYDGYAWYQKAISIPESWNGHDLEVVFGGIDDKDWTYWNGNLIGHKEIWNEERIYPVSSELIRTGRPNVIAVRVFDNVFGGGIWKPPVAIRLKPKLGQSTSRPH